MSGEYDPLPSAHEIEDQLARMVAHPLFQVRAKQTAIFKYLVRSHLDGKEISVRALAKEFFRDKGYADEKGSVRSQVKLIRDLLREYYEGAGGGDPVRIDFPVPIRMQMPNRRITSIRFPAGRAYRPAISYNPRHDIAQLYRLGMQQLVPKRPSDPERALLTFERILEREPEYAGAPVGAAEALLMSVTLGFPTLPRSLSLAADWAECAVELYPREWRAHAVSGAAAFVERRMAQASTAFDAALVCDNTQTGRYPWYHAFLLATGNESDALRLAKTACEEAPADAVGFALYGLFLYIAGRDDQVRAIARHALALDHNCWVAHLVIAMHRLESPHQSGIDGAFEDMCALQSCFRPSDLDSLPSVSAKEDWSFPGLMFLCRAHSSATAANISASRQKAKGQIWRKSYRHLHSFRQAAFYALAENKLDEAVTALKKAGEEGDPIILFMHLIPLFDRLRTRKAFKALLQRRLSPIR